MHVPFWSLVDENGPIPEYAPHLGPCWIWTGRLNPMGYGGYGRGALAHCLAYEEMVGPVPEGLELDHLCRVRHCVRPTHMEPVTHAENMRRGGAAVTHCRRGEHELSGDNVRFYLTKNGHEVRVCRACEWARDRRPVVCECGQTTMRANLARHRQTGIHAAALSGSGTALERIAKAKAALA